MSLRCHNLPKFSCVGSVQSCQIKQRTTCGGNTQLPRIANNKSASVIRYMTHDIVTESCLCPFWFFVIFFTLMEWAYLQCPCWRHMLFPQLKFALVSTFHSTAKKPHLTPLRFSFSLPHNNFLLNAPTNNFPLTWTHPWFPIEHTQHTHDFLTKWHTNNFLLKWAYLWFPVKSAH